MFAEKRVASRKQVFANQANAKRSTGPKTASGKSRARTNAIKHGLTAKRIVIAGEDPSQFELFWAEIEREVAPTTEMARQLTQRLVLGLWRLRRVASFEASIIAARATEVSLEEARTENEFIREKMDEIAARYAPPKSNNPAFVEPDTKTTEPKDLSQLFWRKIGVALTLDSQLLDTLGNLSRHESASLNQLSKIWHLLPPTSPCDAARKVRETFQSEIIPETIVIGDEDPAQFVQMRADLIEQYSPRIRIERELIHYLAGLFWRLRRIPALESAFLEKLRNKVSPETSKAEEERVRGMSEIAAKFIKNAGFRVPERSEKDMREALEFQKAVEAQRKEKLHRSWSGPNPGQSRSRRVGEVVQL